MLFTAAVFAVISAAVSFYIFLLETLKWTDPETMAVFRVKTSEEAAITQQLAYNQGFYNLFLAVGAALGVLLLVLGNSVAGVTLMSFSTACMALAAVVLAASDRRMVRAALVQGGPAALALLFTLLGV